MFAIDQHNPYKDAVARPTRLRYLDPRFYLAKMAAKGEHLRVLLMGVRRRQGWFLEQLTIRKALNMAVSGAQYFFKHEHAYAIPPVVKIDISPMCNLSCTVCVHADPNGDPALEKQHFDPKHRMSVEQYRKIINQIRGRAAAVSLYYVGDPLVHPDLDEMCSIARDAGLNVHISTNFSFSLNDARIRRMVRSGLTHLSVCVDGLSQAKYERTRVGGRIDKVLHNLRRVVQYRNEEGRTYPKVEVQYIKFQHNVDEVEPARKMLEDMGIDQFTDFWGDLGNYVEHDPEYVEVLGPHKKGHVPLCYWPHNSMVIKYNGDVIPCCSFRIGHQYSTTNDARIFGNVFQTSVAEVWNNEKFRQARRMVSNPEIVLKEPHLKEHFCYACPALFQTTDPAGRNFANNIQWDEHYTLGADGRPIPKRKSTQSWKAGQVVQIGLPNGQVATV